MFARNLVPRLLIGPLSEITEIATIKILQTSTERWLVVIMLISPVFSKILIYAGIFLQMMFLRESILHTAKYGHTASERVLCEQGSRLLFTKNNTNHFHFLLGIRREHWGYGQFSESGDMREQIVLCRNREWQIWFWNAEFFWAIFFF